MSELQVVVCQLGAESYKDRQAATEELVKMGPAIAPMLQKQLNVADMEIRPRIEDILERITSGKQPPAGGEGPTDQAIDAGG